LLNYQKGIPVAHRLSTGAEDVLAPIVVPIVEYLRQQVYVPSGRDETEKVTGDDFAALGKSSRLNFACGSGDDGGAIEYDAREVRIGAEQCQRSGCRIRLLRRQCGAPTQSCTPRQQRPRHLVRFEP